MKVISNLIGFILVIALIGCGMKVSVTPSPTTTESVPALSPSTLTQENKATGPSNSASGALPAESMISASQLDAAIKANKDWQIVDVRESIEYATGHVPTAMHIPLGSLKTRQTEISKDKAVILVCLNGTRAFSAWQTLTQEGYDPHRLKVLLGGMEQWKRLGSGEITESIGGC